MAQASKQKSHATEDDDVPKRLKYFLDHKKISFLKQQFRHYDADQSGAISTDGTRRGGRVPLTRTSATSLPFP